MAKYLITGGAGCIGSHLSETLLKLGHSIVSLDNFDAFYAESIKQQNLRAVESTAKACEGSFKNIRGDIRDAALVDKIFGEEKIEGIFHIAALAGVRPSLENPVRYWDVNCTGTAALLEAARKHQIKKLVFASSSSVYGNCDTAPFSEDLFVGNPVSPYAATKRAGELLCYNFSHLYGINSICIRFFTVYGPRQRPDLAIHKFTKLLFNNQEIPFFGDGQTERDYTYITDICDGLVKAMDYAANCPFDIFNLGESNTLKLSELVFLLEKYTGKKAQLKKLPMQPGDVQRTWADVSKAGKILGYSPKVSKEEGLKKFVEWYKSEYLS